MHTEKMVYTDADLAEVISQVEMSRIGPTNWHWAFEWKPFRLPDVGGERKGWLLWVTFDRVNVDDGSFGRGRGRDVVLWAGTGKSGVVKTLWMQVELVVRHELFHAFRYQGRELFDPHAPVDLLHHISGQAADDSYRQWAPRVESDDAVTRNREVA